MSAENPQNQEKEWYIHPGAKFAYDPVENLFVMESGEERVTTDSISSSEHRRLIYHGKEETSGLILNPLGLVISPDLRQALIALANDPEKLRFATFKTAAVMRDVLRANSPTFDEIEQLIDEEAGEYRNPEGDFMSFRVQINPNSGLFYLNTRGNCACLGPDMHAMGSGGPYVSSWEDRTDLPVTLGRHNNDTDAQVLSLLAGAGTIAWIAEGRQSNQMELGLI